MSVYHLFCLLERVELILLTVVSTLSRIAYAFYLNPSFPLRKMNWYIAEKTMLHSEELEIERLNITLALSVVLVDESVGGVGLVRCFSLTIWGCGANKKVLVTNHPTQ